MKSDFDEYLMQQKTKLENLRFEFEHSEYYDEIRYKGGSIYDSGDFSDEFYSFPANIQYAIKKVANSIF